MKYAKLGGTLTNKENEAEEHHERVNLQDEKTDSVECEFVVKESKKQKVLH